MSILQDLYDSEINVSISTFWDAGYDMKIGDNMNGFDEEGSVETWAEVEPWLERAAIAHYPDSVFAQNRRKSA